MGVSNRHLINRKSQMRLYYDAIHNAVTNLVENTSITCKFKTYYSSH